jgi:hypothetical protein
MAEDTQRGDYDEAGDGGADQSWDTERGEARRGIPSNEEEEDSIRSALLRKKMSNGGDGEDVERADPNDSTNCGDDDLAKLRENLARVTPAGRWHGSGQHHIDSRAPWRKELAEVLESTWTHVFIVTLLLVDLLATAIDILKTIHNKSHDLDACVAMVEACTSCIGHFERSKEWEWTYWLSIVILIVLLVNIAGLFVAFGFSFFTHPGYVLDLVVVATALLLEILLDADTAGLLIILTLWRIVRVAHGIFEVTDEAWEKDMHKLEAQIEAVQTAHDKDQGLLQEKERRIAELESQLNYNG